MGKLNQPSATTQKLKRTERELKSDDFWRATTDWKVEEERKAHGQQEIIE
jgi:hypothetical protein